jgi:UDP-N-acetylmuramyl pentapeptide synthase
MEYFKTIDAVAKEELAIAGYSKQVLVNGDDVDDKFMYLAKNKLINKYGVASTNDYYFSYDEYNLNKGYVGTIEATELSKGFPAEIFVFGAHSIRPVVAAAAVGIKFGMKTGRHRKRHQQNSTSFWPYECIAGQKQHSFDRRYL